MNKENPIAKSPAASIHRDLIEYIFLTASLCFILLLCLFPVRNNDVWWHMAAGREILRTKHFITSDIFSFATAGRPWVPQSYFSGIVFYLVYTVASAPGLIALRVLLVMATFLSLIRIISRAGLSYAFAAPFIIMAALTMHSRFIIRPHLFEYLFIAVLLVLLYSGRRKRGAVFYLPPAVLQLLWTNMHPSYFLGPAIVFLFYFGEAVSRWACKRTRFVAPPRDGFFEWKPALMLFLLLIVVSFVNPSPVPFLKQPMGGEQRQLISRYTLEWRSPFDPALRHAAFHPYYEIMLVWAAACFILGATRLQISSLIIVAFFALLSLKAHRFRVEFAVAALPLALVQFEASFLAEKLRALVSVGAGKSRILRGSFALILFVIIAYSARDRIVVAGGTADRYPKKALSFIRKEGIAKRSFESIGFGSYLLWDLYPQRKSFIDGRNYAPDLYMDFLACQSDERGFKYVVRKYDLDAFLLPEPSKCDKGMMNVHGFLAKSKEWDLVFVERNAFLYVKSASVPDAWLAENAYRRYGYLRAEPEQYSHEEAEALEKELLRTVGNDSLYSKAWIDLGLFYMKLGRISDAVEPFDKACKLDPSNAKAWHLAGIAAARSGLWSKAIGAFEKEAEISPRSAIAYFNLAEAYEALGDRESAMRNYNEVLIRDRNYTKAYLGLFNIYADAGKWDKALEVSHRLSKVRPYDYRGPLLISKAHIGKGDLKEALINAERSEKLAPKSSDVHALLGGIYLRMGEARKAEREALRALEINPQNEEASWLLEKLGRSP